jgi:hypothetical protein
MTFKTTMKSGLWKFFLSFPLLFYLFIGIQYLYHHARQPATIMSHSKSRATTFSAVCPCALQYNKKGNNKDKGSFTVGIGSLMMKRSLNSGM